MKRFMKYHRGLLRGAGGQILDQGIMQATATSSARAAGHRLDGQLDSQLYGLLVLLLILQGARPWRVLWMRVQRLRVHGLWEQWLLKSWWLVELLAEHPLKSHNFMLEHRYTALLSDGRSPPQIPAEQAQMLCYLCLAGG